MFLIGKRLSRTFLWFIVFLIFIRAKAHVSLRVICMCGFQYDIKDTMIVFTSLSRVLLWVICKVNINERLDGFLECQGPARRKGVAAGCGSRVLDKGQGAGFGGLPGVFGGKARSFGRAGAGGRGTREKTGGNGLLQASRLPDLRQRLQDLLVHKKGDYGQRFRVSPAGSP
jgi:hypothetical protein